MSTVIWIVMTMSVIGSIELLVRAATNDRSAVRVKERRTVLAELAAENAAEFIVVGSRGRGVWRSAALGSVSAELVRLAYCPVMVVPDLALEKQRTA